MNDTERKSLIAALRRKPKRPRPTGHVIVMEEHKAWGDNLYWLSYPGDKRGSKTWKLGSHAIRIPSVGDEIRCTMRSGSVGRWIVTGVKRCNDPPDMFFADCTELEPFYVS